MVIDLDTLCYKFSLDRNAVSALPILEDRRGRWHHVLGIDLGYSPDPSAFVVAAYHDHDRTLYFVGAGSPSTSPATASRNAEFILARIRLVTADCLPPNLGH